MKKDTMENIMMAGMNNGGKGITRSREIMLDSLTVAW